MYSLWLPAGPALKMFTLQRVRQKRVLSETRCRQPVIDLNEACACRALVTVAHIQHPRERPMNGIARGHGCGI